MPGTAGHAGTAYVTILPDFGRLNRELAGEGHRISSTLHKAAGTLHFKGDTTQLQRSVKGAERAVGGYGRTAERAHRGVRKRAEESVAANVALTGSFRQMARTAVTAGAGFVAAYVGISKAKDAIKSTEELAHATEILHRNTGLSIKSSSDWIAIAHSRGVQAGALNMSFTRLSKAFLGADAGQKAAVDSLKLLGLNQKQVHAGATNFDTALRLTADSLGKMKGGTDRLAASQQVLGRGAKDLVPLFADGAKGLDEQLANAKKYGVELNARTLPLLNKLVANQRQTRLASLGLKVAFTTAVAPALLRVEGASLRLAKVWNDPRLTNDQKWHKIGQTIGGMWHQVEGQFQKAIPKIANSIGHNAPKLASALVTGFLKADAWGKLAIAAFLLKKMGGLGAFRAVGAAGGAATGEGMLTATTTTVTGGAAASRWSRLGTRIGGLVGPQAGVALAVALEAVTLTQVAKIGSKLHKKLGTAGGAAAGVGLGTLAGPAGSGVAGIAGAGGFDFAVDPTGRRTGQAIGGASGVAAANKRLLAETRTINALTASFDGLTKSQSRGAKSLSDLGAKAVASSRRAEGLTGSLKEMRVAQRTVNSFVDDGVSALTHLGRQTQTTKGRTDAYKGSAKDLRAAQRNVNAAVDAGTSALGGYSSHARGAKGASDTARGGVSNLRGSFHSLGRTVGDVATTIRDNVNNILKGFGAKPIAIQVLSSGATATGVAKARGGLVQFGIPGDRGRDTIPVRFGGQQVAVGSGEVGIVLNGPQIADMNARTADKGGLKGYFDQPWPEHSKAPAGRAFATGGFTNPKHVHVGLSGPASYEKDVAVAAEGKMERAANRLIDKKAAQAAAKAAAAAAASAGGGLTSAGKGQLAHWNGIPVARWLYNALVWASHHGGNTQITSGYRPGFDPHAASGRSEHQGLVYPHGAIDFGGFVDPVALQHKLSFLHSLRGYPGPKPILPIGFRDDGHTSGTGHQRGGIIGKLLGEHAPKAPPGGLPPLPPAAMQMAKRDPRHPGMSFFRTVYNRLGQLGLRPQGPFPNIHWDTHRGNPDNQIWTDADSRKINFPTSMIPYLWVRNPPQKWRGWYSWLHEAPIHEMAHTWQRKGLHGNREVEGGAQLYTDIVAPSVLGSMGIHGWKREDANYSRYVRWVKRHHNPHKGGIPWAMRGQFRYGYGSFGQTAHGGHKLNATDDPALEGEALGKGNVHAAASQSRLRAAINAAELFWSHTHGFHRRKPNSIEGRIKYGATGARGETFGRAHAIIDPTYANGANWPEFARTVAHESGHLTNFGHVSSDRDIMMSLANGGTWRHSVPWPATVLGQSGSARLGHPITGPGNGPKPFPASKTPSWWKGRVSTGGGAGGGGGGATTGGGGGGHWVRGHWAGAKGAKYDKHQNPYGSTWRAGEYSGLAHARGLSKSRAITAGAIAMAETAPHGFFASIGDGGNSRGPWQVYAPAHPSYSHHKLLTDPWYTAGAMKDISGGGANWHPWSTYNNGLHRPFLSAAARMKPYLGKLVSKGRRHWVPGHHVNGPAGTGSSVKGQISKLTQRLLKMGINKGRAVKPWTAAIAKLEDRIQQDEDAYPHLTHLAEIGRSENGKDPVTLEVENRKDQLDALLSEQSLAQFALPAFKGQVGPLRKKYDRVVEAVKRNAIKISEMTGVPVNAGTPTNSPKPKPGDYETGPDGQRRVSVAFARKQVLRDFPGATLGKPETEFQQLTYEDSPHHFYAFDVTPKGAKKATGETKVDMFTGQVLEYEINDKPFWGDRKPVGTKKGEGEGIAAVIGALAKRRGGGSHVSKAFAAAQARRQFPGHKITGGPATEPEAPKYHPNAKGLKWAVDLSGGNEVLIDYYTGKVWQWETPGKIHDGDRFPGTDPTHSYTGGGGTTTTTGGKGGGKKPSGKPSALDNLYADQVALTGFKNPKPTDYWFHHAKEGSLLGKVWGELGSRIASRDTLTGILHDLSFVSPAGTIGGKIQDKRDEIESLGGSAAGVTANSALADALRQKLQETNLALDVSERHFKVLRDSADLLPPYGGSFATGGVVPGPAGEARTIIAHGGEVITPAEHNGGGADIRVIVEDHRVRVFRDDVEQIVHQVTRQQARSAGRPLPGRSGVLA